MKDGIVRILFGFGLAMLPLAARAAAPVVNESQGDNTPYTIFDAQKRFDAAEKKKQQKDPNYKPASFVNEKNAICYVAADGYQPRRWPGKEADPSGAAALPFLRAVKVLLETQGDREFSLVGDPDVNLENGADYTVYGWVPTRSIVKSSLCLRDDVTKIFKKAIVLNSADYIRGLKNQSVEELRPPKVNRSIEGGAPKSGERELTFFQFFYVWADTNPNSETEGEVLLGENALYNSADTTTSTPLKDRAKVFGWVSKNRLCFWNTSEGVEWNGGSKSRLPARGFQKLDEAEKDSKGLGVGSSSEIEIFGGNQPVPWKPRMMRFPRLDITYENKAKKLVTDPSKAGYPGEYGQNALYRIGVIGDVLGEGDSSVGRGVKQDFNQELAIVREQLKQTEILFVMDRTASMAPWYGLTVQTVEKLIANTDGDNRKLSVAFCYYADVSEGGREGKATKADALKESPPRIQVTALLPVDQKPDSPFQRELETLRQIGNSENDKLRKPGDAGLWIGGDPPEMLYFGLEHGLEQTKWSPHSRKMVVLIGDHGNHPLNAEDDAKKHRELVDLLRPSGVSPIEFYALHAYEKTEDKNKRAAVELFRDQMTALVAAASQPPPPKKDSTPQPIGQAKYLDLKSDKEAFLKSIADRYQSLRDRAEELDRSFSELQNGSGKLEDPEVIAVLKLIALKKGLKTDEWRRMIRGIQPFQVHLVWELDPKTQEPQIRKKVLVSRSDIESVQKDMFNDIFNPDRPLLSLDGVMEKVVSAMTRQDPNFDWKNKDKFLAAHFRGLSFRAELYELWTAPNKNAAQLPELLYKLQMKHLRLQDILADKKREFLPPQVENGKKIIKFAEPVDLKPDELRWFKQGDGKDKYYWLDLLEEWP